MKRLKTICLSLFVCFCLSLHVGIAQSSSCAAETNISVDASCQFIISPQILRASGPAASAGSITLVGTGSTSAFVNGEVHGSIISLGLPNGGQVQYRLYASSDGTGPMVCWGHINFEIKSIPDPIITVTEIMCSQPYPDLPDLNELQAQINGLCSAPISDLVETIDTEGEACTGFITVRKITGIIDYGDFKVPTPLIIDTIIERPLDTGMVVGPFGGPSKLEAILLFCDDIGNKYPTPEVVEEYAPRGVRDAYPYIPKGLDTTYTDRDTIITLEEIVQQKLLVTDDDGNEYWVLTDVIDKRDTLITVTDTTITDIVLPLREGPTCNLSTKYTDEAFPGCAGPDSKIMRTWSILDWCNGSLKQTVQWIIVETEGPIIKPVKDRFVAIAPWLCSAQLKLSAEIDKGCSETLQVIFQSSIGFVDENNILSGLWLGEVAEVLVTAIDDCGQRALDTFYVTPVDSIAPVAIAEDQINVTLSGDPLVEETLEDRGVAKVFVDAIDAGSHNSGCGEVDICLLLKEERENPVFLNGVHASVDGKLIYHAFGCYVDGILPAIPDTKTTDGRPEIPYVFCKEYVKFCCASLGLNSVAMIVRNGSDREAVTWTNVFVEDKTSPIVICPQPFKVGCGEEFDIPQPVIFHGVCSIDELEMTMTEDFDNCGNGVKNVIWTRNGDVICTTVITIDADSRFNPYEIKWPKHYNNDDVPGIRRECELLVDDEGDAIRDDDGNEQFVIVEYDDLIEMGDPFECSGGGFTGEPVWCISTCGLIGVNFEDLNVEAIGACKKILRKWTVIDWCTWDPNNSSIDDENDSFDSFTAIDDTWLGDGDWLTDKRNTVGEYCEECEKPAGVSDDIYFRYDTVDVDGYYSYDQVIKILDFDDPVVTAPDTITLSIFGGAGFKGDNFDDCFSSDITSATVTDMCGDTEIDASKAGWFIQVFKLNDGVEELLATKDFFGSEATMSTQVGMTGDVHLIRWIVKDNCGNEGSAETYVIFIEDKNPTPLCIQRLSTSTMNTDGTATIWATDFDAGSFDNCSEVDLFFKDSDGNYSPSLTFRCEDIDDGLSEVFDLELYAVDALGNFDFCNVSLRVDDFNDNCPNSSVDPGSENEVSGAIATSFGDMVEEAEVSLNVGMKDMTSVVGKYAFKDIAYSAFEISAEKDNDYLNGVSSLDVVLIQRHLLGASLLDTPYKVMAADINNDGRISALDLVDLRKLILGVYDDLPRNKSWRFVDASQKFENASIPFPFIESIVIDDYQGSAKGQNFIAVKIGDVNGSAIANSLIDAGSRSAGMLSLKIEDAYITKGEIVEVAMTSENFLDITAYQYTMELTGLEFVAATSGAIEVGPSNFGMLDANTVTTAWFSPEGVTVNDELYRMVFRATENVQLSQAFTISSRITTAIAYTASQTRLDIGMEYFNLEALSYSLMQNVPNPFLESTTIGFELPQAGNATITVMDVTGKKIMIIEGTYGIGYNEVILKKSELGSGGVLYYQLESGDFTTTRKMIMIE